MYPAVCLNILGNTDNLFPIKLMKGKLKIYNDNILRDVFTKHLHHIFSLRTVIVFLCMQLGHLLGAINEISNI